MEQVVSPELAQPAVDIPASDPSSIPASEIDATFAGTTLDLASAALGSEILRVSDEFFAPASNLTNPRPPVSKPGVFVETGAWYDGWESRRHNARGSDFVVLRLGAPGHVHGIEVDTAYFTGNHAPEVSVEGAHETGADADAAVAADDYAGWTAVLGRKACAPSTRHAWKVGPASARLTHVRLRQFPDGGIARLRVYGVAAPDLAACGPHTVLEVSAAANGGLAVAASDQHYGTAANLLLPGRGKDMGDGWETKRSRGEGHVDWAIVKFPFAASVDSVVVDTMHFRGNFPREVKVHVAKNLETNKPDDAGWVQVAHHTKMGADTEFEFKPSADVAGMPAQYAMLTMVPDGGVKRFRIFGRKAA